MAAVAAGLVVLAALLLGAGGAVTEAFRREAGHPQWHHGAFQELSGKVKMEAHELLRSGAEVPFRVPLEVKVVLVGLKGDGGYRYLLEEAKVEQFLSKSMRWRRPACLETGQLLDIKQEVVYKVMSVGIPEVMAVEWELRRSMREAGVARIREYEQEVAAYEVEGTDVEAVLERVYESLFGVDANWEDANAALPTAIFILNPDKVRMDPRLAHEAGLPQAAQVSGLDDKELRAQEGGYIYRYRYNGGGSSQVWLGRGRYAVVDLAAGPCTYGRVGSEEGSIGYKSVPRLSNLLFPRGRGKKEEEEEVVPTAYETRDMLMGQLSSVVASAIEHVISPDVRFETLDFAQRLLVPVMVLHNHQVHKAEDSTADFGIDMAQVEEQVKKLAQAGAGQEVVVVGGVHSLHAHPRLSIAVHKAVRGEWVRETGNGGREEAKSRSYLDGAILREEMVHSADVLAAGLLEVAEPGLSVHYFGSQGVQAEEGGGDGDVIKTGATEKKWSSTVKRGPRGTRVVPVFVLSLAGFDEKLTMDGESLWWAGHDSVFVLQHQSDKVPLSTVSESKRRQLQPRLPQRHIVAGLASVVGGLVAPYEKASHIHDRPVINWLWASGHHPFGPFSNTSTVSRIMLDTCLRNGIYAQVGTALRGIRRATQKVQTFVSESLTTPVGGAVKEQKGAAPWVDRFYHKTSRLPQPAPHQLVDRLEAYLDGLEARLVELSSCLYDHRLLDALGNSSRLLQTVLATERYVEDALALESDKMRCCSVEYKKAAGGQWQGLVYYYAGILIAGFSVYFLVIYFSPPPPAAAAGRQAGR